MNAFELLEAMTDINDKQIQSAQQYLIYASQQTQTHRPIHLKRILLLFAATLSIMAATLATAMAVNTDFRTFVFEILRIEQPHIIEDPTLDAPLTAENMYVEAPTIGDPIQARRVHTPVASHARNGVFLLCTDEVEMRQGSSYDAYYEQDGELIKLEQKHFHHDYSLYGADFSIELDWVDHQNAPKVTQIDPNQPIRIPNHSGPTSAALVQFLLPQNGSWYPVLLNFHTGEVTDVLADTGADQLSGIDKAAISPDYTKMLLGQLSADDYLLYYADISSKTLYSLDYLFGQHIDACSLIDNTLACWSYQDGGYTVWNLNLDTMEKKLLLEGKPDAFASENNGVGLVFLMGFDNMNHWGEMYVGSRFALEADVDRHITIIDLKTGLSSPLEGFLLPVNAQWVPSPDGKKLLIAAGENGMDLEYIGILDTERYQLTEFTREHGTLGEFGPYWFDQNTVVLMGAVNSDSLSADYFLYQINTKQKEG